MSYSSVFLLIHLPPWFQRWFFFVFKENDEMLGRKIVQFVKVGILVDMDEDTLSAAVEGIFAQELSEKLETLLEMLKEAMQEEAEGTEEETQE